MPKSTKKPLAFSLDGRPELWHTINVDVGEPEPYAARIKYWILTKAELDARREEETRAILDQAKESQANDDGSDLDRQIAILERVVESISPEKGAAQVAELQERVLDWDVIDAASGKKGDKLPCTAETVAKLCEYEVIFQAMYAGLLAASGDARKKS